MSIKKIYLIGLIIMTLFIICLFVLQNNDHKKELERINNLELKYKQEQQKLQKIRNKTIPCFMKNLNDPRSCYFNSNYKCRWNDEANRCDQS